MNKNKADTMRMRELIHQTGTDFEGLQKVVPPIRHYLSMVYRWVEDE